jgi:hypothetical protein
MSNEIRSKLTEHENNFRPCNLNLMNCYAGLYPATLTKLSMVIFNKLLSNKKYLPKTSQYYDEKEAKRIFTNIAISPVDLLKDCHPLKYRIGGQDANKDSGNLVKRLKELDENNIFYIWRFGRPSNYMFVLERDIGLWKFYNKSAYVTPKTIKKIVMSTKGMCDSMYSIASGRGDSVDVREVRESFCSFVDRIVNKSSKDVKDKLPKWESYSDCKEYLTTLNKAINNLGVYEGLNEDESFYESLPSSVVEKIKPNKKQPRAKNMISEIGDDGNIVSVVSEKRKRKRRPKKGELAKVEKFKRSNPLKDSSSLVRYYRSILKDLSGDVKFGRFENDVQFAASILDQMKNDNYDETFFFSFAKFFFETKLKGNNITDYRRTSMENIKNIYSYYKERYIG